MRRDAQASQKVPRDLESGQDWVRNFSLVNMRVLGITSHGVHTRDVQRAASTAGMIMDTAYSNTSTALMQRSRDGGG